MVGKFHIRTHEARSLTWWHKAKSKIDFQPPYQRKGQLWSTTDKAYLIDSILNGYDVPKLYLADFTWGVSQLNTARLPYAVIDGKQRLEAIFDFFESKLELNRDFVYYRDPSLRLGGLNYTDLRATYGDIADEFDNYNLTIMGVFAENEEPIRELFVRLNRSKALTGAEIRNAMRGPVPDIVRSISGHSFFTDYVRFSVDRGQDKNTAAKILIFEYNGKPQDTKKAALDAFVEGHATASDKLELSGRKSIEGLDDLTKIFMPRDTLLSSSGIVPVYYWFAMSVPPEQHHRIREFLVYFEENRGLNRERARNSDGVGTGQEAANVYLRFDNFNRSTNDIGSHAGRVKILLDEFNKFARR